MKVIDLLNKIARGENPKFEKDGRTYEDSIFSFINMYFGSKTMKHKEVVDWLNSEITIIEENSEEQEIEEMTTENFYTDNEKLFKTITTIKYK